VATRRKCGGSEEAMTDRPSLGDLLFWEAWLTGLWILVPAMLVGVLVFVVRLSIDRFRNRRE